MGTNQQARKRFTLILIKPSHYDDDGYVIQWLRSAIPSNTLAVIHGLALDCQERRVLGDDVDIVIKALDETNTHIRPDRIARQLGKEPGMVALIGVQSNQFPRAMDIARPLRAAGVQVCIGGFHVSGCLSMLPEITPELKDAMNLGVSLFAGEAEGRFEDVLKDASQGKLKPLYNYMDDLPSLEGVPMPILPATRVKRTGGKITTFDAGRGCPFLCSFCTIINVQGRKSRRRSVDDIEQIIRRNLAQGINRFFITDDNFARNTDWEIVFDRLIAMREGEKLNIKFVIQVDTMCHRLPHFIEKAGRAGRVARRRAGLRGMRAYSGARRRGPAVRFRAGRIDEHHRSTSLGAGAAAPGRRQSDSEGGQAWQHPLLARRIHSCPGGATRRTRPDRSGRRVCRRHRIWNAARAAAGDHVTVCQHGGRLCRNETWSDGGYTGPRGRAARRRPALRPLRRRHLLTAPSRSAYVRWSTCTSAPRISPSVWCNESHVQHPAGSSSRRHWRRPTHPRAGARAARFDVVHNGTVDKNFLH